jgi:hypothetical protein
MTQNCLLTRACFLHNTWSVHKMVLRAGFKKNKLRLCVELKIYDKNRRKITGPQCVKMKKMFALLGRVNWICRKCGGLYTNISFHVVLLMIFFKNESFIDITLNTQDLLLTIFSVPKEWSFIFRKLLASVCVHLFSDWMAGVILWTLFDKILMKHMYITPLEISPSGYLLIFYRL